MAEAVTLDQVQTKLWF